VFQYPVVPFIEKRRMISEQAVIDFYRAYRVTNTQQRGEWLPEPVVTVRPIKKKCTLKDLIIWFIQTWAGKPRPSILSTS